MNEVTSASRVVTHTSIYWDYTPDDELYLKYKDVFDNPRYYNQETGAINWTEKNEFADIPMDDRIRMHDYSKEQLLLLIEDYVTINFQGMKYQTREAILNMICDAVNYYDIGKDLNWESIIAIREDLEDDLKEYVDEIISMHYN